MKNVSKFLLGGIAAFIMAGPAVVHAKECHDHRGGMWGERHDFDENRMRERWTKRHAELHDKLGLNTSQEAAWKTFTDRIQPGVKPARPDQAELMKLPVPERMERMLAVMKERQANMGQRLAATREFYATLNPAQQKIFNEQFGPRHKRRAQ